MPRGPRGSVAEIFVISSLLEALGSSLGQLPVPHRQKLGVATQSFEQGLVRTGQPGLAIQPEQRIEQCRAPARIEMCADLVEEQEGRLTPHRPLQSRLSENDRDEQSLLLARRG